MEHNIVMTSVTMHVSNMNKASFSYCDVSSHAGGKRSDKAMHVKLEK
jgi:hypothetical protein